MVLLKFACVLRHGRLLAAGLALFLGIAAAQRADASLIAYNNYTNGTIDNGFTDFGPGGATVSSRFAVGDEFTATATGNVSAIYASIYDFGSSAGVPLALYAADGPVVNGAASPETFLGSYGGSPAPASGGGNVATLFMGTAAPLVSGDTYWLITVSDAGQNYAWAESRPPVVGTIYDTGNSPPEQPGSGLNSLEVVVTPTPEPTTIVLGIFGFSCCVAARGFRRLRFDRR